MIFSAEDRVRLEQSYDAIRLRIKLIQNDPSWLPTPQECPHIWDRLKRLAEMSREELIAEIEADYVLFC